MHIFASIIYNLTLATALYAVVMAIIHLRKQGNGRYLAQARSALELTLIAVSICVALLLFVLVSADYSIVYVAEHVNNQLPVFYRMTSLWAGQAGSMLWWNFLVVFFSWLAVKHIRRAAPALEAWMLIILMTLVAFFTAIGCFAPSSDPFRVFQEGEKLFAHAEGRGL
ncbi:MAG TPA: hypothetical protein PKD60_11940, partial [Turneriella sp.]|nr:hypothetical protein [Turneriella sp.]